MKIDPSSLQKIVDGWLAEEIGGDSPLEKVAAYALLGGKRVRPVLLLWLGWHLTGDIHAFKEAALSVELFHTASLITDDCPFMDNALMRREHPACHCQFGVSDAVLASYALISSGYALLTRIPISEQERLFLVKEASDAFGFFGACLGQYLDIHGDDDLENIMTLKTGKLFEMCFVLAWLIAGKGLSCIDTVKEIALHFGKAFQIADDILDIAEDAHKEKNNPTQREDSLSHFHREIEAMTHKMRLIELELPWEHWFSPEQIVGSLRE